MTLLRLLASFMLVLMSLTMTPLTMAAAGADVRAKAVRRTASRADGIAQASKTPAVEKQAAKSSAAAPAKKVDSSERPSFPGLTPAREAAVMTFVRRHHADLTKLLVYLKKERPRDYARAVRELFRVSERLAQVQEKDGDQYVLELHAWKVQSRIELLAARAKMTNNPKVLEELERALHEQIDLRRQVLVRDRDKLRARAEKLDAQWTQLEDQRDKSVARRIRLLLKSSGKKPAAKEKSGKSRSQRETVKP